MTTATEIQTPGFDLAERLGFEVQRIESGHDLVVACHQCDSSGAARIHQDTGAFNCYACNQQGGALWLAETKLGNRPEAIRLLVDVGLFEDRQRQSPPQSKAGGVRLSAPSIPASPQPPIPPPPSQPVSGDAIDRFAQLKHTSADGLRAYGAKVNSLAPQQLFDVPMIGPDGTPCSSVAFSPGNTKGKSAAGKPTGLFLPTGRLPQPGEQWILCEGCKDAAALWQLGYLAAGRPGTALKPEFAPMFAGVNAVIMPDADIPGWNKAKKSANLLGDGARIARLPCEIIKSQGQDVRDIQQSLGPDAIHKAIAEALPGEKYDKDGNFAEPPRFITELYSSSQFLELDLEHKYLIDGVLVAGQPCVIGGRSKSLKTSIAVDLAVSLGSGMPFLNRFNAERVNVAIFSGESGATTIRETAQRVANSKEVDLRQCSILWGFSLPKLSMVEHLDAMAELIVSKKLDVVVVDPLYLSLLSAETAGSAGNLFAMGSVLLPLSEMAQETGVTIVLLHHFRKSALVDDSEPCNLESLSQSGIAEWARQWLLLERRSPYAMDGHHELYLRTGGSAGHGGLWGVDVNEGTLELGRKWSLKIRAVEDIWAENRRAKEQRKNEEQIRREDEQCTKLVEVLRKFPDGETLSVLRPEAKRNGINSSYSDHRNFIGTWGN